MIEREYDFFINTPSEKLGVCLDEDRAALYNESGALVALIDPDDLRSWGTLSGGSMLTRAAFERDYGS